MADRPYSRIYHELADEYPTIYDSPDLGAYVRLLVAADQSWPSRARWAGYVDEDEATRLEAAGLIAREGARYAVKGMDKERKRRSKQASNAARSRYSSADSNAASSADRSALSSAVRSAASTAQRLPRRDETSRDETSRDEKRRDKKSGLTSVGDVFEAVR